MGQTGTPVTTDPQEVPQRTGGRLVLTIRKRHVIIENYNVVVFCGFDGLTKRPVDKVCILVLQSLTTDCHRGHCLILFEHGVGVSIVHNDQINIRIRFRCAHPLTFGEARMSITGRGD
jgi:hypothetical protein